MSSTADLSERSDSYLYCLLRNKCEYGEAKQKNNMPWVYASTEYIQPDAANKQFAII